MRLTKAETANLIAAGKERYVADDAVHRFGLRVRSKTSAQWILAPRVNVAKQRVTVGNALTMPLDEARREARPLLGQIDAGRDPVAEKRTPTFADLWQLYVASPLFETKADRACDEGCRVAAFLTCAVWTGARVSELLGARWGDLKGDQIVVHRSKASRVARERKVGAIAAAGGLEDDERLGLKRAHPGGDGVAVVGYLRRCGVRKAMKVEAGA